MRVKHEDAALAKAFEWGLVEYRRVPGSDALDFWLTPEGTKVA